MDTIPGPRETGAVGQPTARSAMRRIRSLVDSSLTHLDLDDMLAELLNRVRALLNTDTAAILVHDGSDSLVARAASGLEEELYQNVRLPIGHGFAGRIAATQEPIVLQKIDETTVINPILWEKGIQSMVGVPLLSGDSLLGVLHVGSLTHRQFTRDDVALLEVVAQRVALAVQTSQLAAEQASAKVLERSLTPSRLPAIEGLEFGARHVPAAHDRGVGGDWYDAFALPSGDLWLVVGDVAGHGLPAAVVMGRLRTMVRAHAFSGAPPDEVMRMTDDMLQFFDPEQTATVVCIAIPPSSDELLICSAGHPPPILAMPGQPAEPLTTQAEPLLGIAADARSTTSIPFPPGALLLMYSDGLIERRDESLAIGMNRLSELVTADHPEVVCSRVMFRLIGGTPPADDVVVLAVRRAANQPPRRSPRKAKSRTGGRQTT